ncbi:metal ABC transporter solute-binding protein, Zn/Mn family [Lentilactobacillus kosonis]|uniref:Zinc ABC transporter, periplasmic-binding protein ZnuA n=1 Tax=Lentilactobacillus kosonis TaxID=2810561 RepID=A0A401FIW0_9LACO|nr:zinc ABC transporter substrate-binding protein [Lentilactobacillus kosonis]GAY72304.1 zinc ABC transporter, periplasmic-binding protein ZnuA [Lentilactobacillus kosonis]
MLLIAGCSSTGGNNPKSGQINIVTTTDFYGEVAKAVVGNKGKVTEIINKPDVDPHDYTPTTNDGKAVAAANVVVANGIGYDGWMDNLVKNNSNVKYIQVGESLMNVKNGDNPHLWYKPATMPKLANALAVRFGKLQPKNKKYFQKNAQNYIKSLQPIDQKVSNLKALAKKSKSKEVYVSEPVFDYALEAAGFKVGNQKFEDDTENGVDQSPTTIKNMQSGIKKRQIAFFVFNKQADSKTVNNMVDLAKKSGVPVLPITETLPAGKNYRTWMISQYNQLENILKHQAK